MERKRINDAARVKEDKFRHNKKAMNKRMKAHLLSAKLKEKERDLMMEERSRVQKMQQGGSSMLGMSGMGGGMNQMNGGGMGGMGVMGGMGGSMGGGMGGMSKGITANMLDSSKMGALCGCACGN